MAEFSPERLLPKEAQEELTSEFKSKGVTGCIKFFERMNEEWKAVPLKVGVIGESGSGKSSFLNTIRGLKAYTPGAAAVDVVEATLIPTEYLHPKNKMLAFWDLPGVGTPRFPQNTYLEKIVVDSYDCFVIMTAGRFTETDVWLAKEISQRKKHFYFIRSKIGIDVRNDKHDKRQHHNEAEVVQRIRQNTTEQLKKLKFDDPIFLIDNHKRSKYDFDHLEQTIINDLPARKRQAMILSLSVFTEAMIKTKVEELRKRTWFAAVLSAGVAAIPVPGVSIAFDAALLLGEIEFYYEQLGLDEESLKQRAHLMGVDYETLKEIVVREFPQAIGMQLLKTLPQVGGYAASMVFEEVARFLPFVGSLVAAPISLAFTKLALEYMLNKMEKTSIELTQYFVVEVEEDEDNEPVDE